ncbi:MAG: hypothetical protein AAGD05_19090, partial [Bacteroidota bacterium]
PYNFDGDWDGSNNWEHASWLADPVVYYHVQWTATTWVITYSLYWARDFAPIIRVPPVFGPNICSADMHEGDSDRIIIVVARPTSDETDPADLPFGVATTHHSESDLATCVDDRELVTDSDPFISGGATHTVVGSSPGSHALYNNHGDAHNDDGTLNPCQPDDEATITYRPGTTAVRVPIGGNTNEVYILEDVLADGGLWDHRFDPLAFPEWAEFACDDYCDGPSLASAPWNGDRGVDAQCWFRNQAFFPPILHCDCRPEDCEPFEVNCDDYVYNPFECSGPDFGFTLNASKDNACLLADEITLTVDGLPSPTPAITWIIPPGFTIVDGGSPSNQVTVVGSAALGVGKHEFDAIVEIPSCFPKLTKSITFTQDIYVDFFTRDNNGDVSNLFCPEELVIIDANGITGEQAYRIQLYRRPAGSSDPYTLAHNFG